MSALTAAVRRGRWALLAAAVAGALLAVVVHHGHARSYEAQATLLVGPANAADPDILQASGQLSESWAAIAGITNLLNVTARQLHHSSLADVVSATGNETTRLLTVRARSRSAADAARVANAHAARLVRISARHGRFSPGRLALVEPATVPTAPTGPSAAAFIGLGVVLAAGAILGLLLLIGAVRDPVRDEHHLRTLTGVEPIADQRVLASRVAVLGADRLLLLGAGRVDVAAVGARLAAALERRGKRVEVIAADAAASGRRSAEAQGDRPDLLVVHAPALDRFPAALAWSRRVGATLVVAQADRTRAREVIDTLERLRLVGAPAAGTVLLRPRSPFSRLLAARVSAREQSAAAHPAGGTAR